jgi:hypothetical protein
VAAAVWWVSKYSQMMISGTITMIRIAAPLATIMVDLPRPDLSAREGVEIIHAHAVDSGPDWQGCMVSSEAAANKNGRLVDGLGAWLVMYRAASAADMIRATLYSWGSLVFRKSTALVEPPPLFLLDTQWIDSTVVAEIVRREPLMEGMEENFGFTLALQAVPDLGLFWYLTRHCLVTPANIALSHQFGVDARNGEITVEVVQRRGPRDATQRRRRDRLTGGDWQDF